MLAESSFLTSNRQKSTKEHRWSPEGRTLFSERGTWFSKKGDLVYQKGTQCTKRGPGFPKGGHGFPKGGPGFPKMAQFPEKRSPLNPFPHSGNRVPLSVNEVPYSGNRTPFFISKIAVLQKLGHPFGSPIRETSPIQETGSLSRETGFPIW